MTQFISFGKEKLNKAHPQVVLALIEEMEVKGLIHASITYVAVIEKDPLNDFTFVGFTAYTDPTEIFKSFVLEIHHAKNFSCASIQLIDCF